MGYAGMTADYPSTPSSARAGGPRRALARCGFCMAWSRAAAQAGDEGGRCAHILFFFVRFSSCDRHMIGRGRARERAQSSILCRETMAGVMRCSLQIRSSSVIGAAHPQVLQRRVEPLAVLPQALLAVVDVAIDLHHLCLKHMPVRLQRGEDVDEVALGLLRG